MPLFEFVRRKVNILINIYNTISESNDNENDSAVKTVCCKGKRRIASHKDMICCENSVPPTETNIQGDAVVYTWLAVNLLVFSLDRFFPDTRLQVCISSDANVINCYWHCPDKNLCLLVALSKIFVVQFIYIVLYQISVDISVG